MKNLRKRSGSHENLRDYFYIEVRFPEIIVQTPQLRYLPLNWHKDPPPLSCRQFGNSCLDSRSAAVLKDPTAVIPHGFNVGINGLHFFESVIPALQNFAHPCLTPQAGVPERMVTGPGTRSASSGLPLPGSATPWAGHHHTATPRHPAA